MHFVTFAAAFAADGISCRLDTPVRVPRVLSTATRRGRLAAPVPEHRINGSDLHFLVTADWGGLPVWPWATPGQQKGAGFWRIAAGNHDHKGNMSAQLEYAARRSSRWRYPALQHAWVEVLSAEDAETEVVIAFILIDTVMLCGPSSKRVKPLPLATARRWGGSDRHWTWLKATLGQVADADYIVMGGHYPIESPSGHGPCGCLRSRLNPLLLRHGVSVYFSGHDHALFHIDGAKLASYGKAKTAAPATALHGVGAGFTASDSVKHERTCARGLRFHYCGEGRLRALGGGFAGAGVSASGLVVTHYDDRGRPLYSHTTPPRAKGIGALARRHAAAAGDGAAA